MKRLLTLSRGTGRGDPKSLAVMFWLAIVAGFLLKGPIVFGFTLLPALAAWAVLRWTAERPAEATAIRRTAFWWPAVVLGVAIIVAWPVAAWREHPAVIAQWRHEIVDRIQGEVGRTDAEREAIHKESPTTAPTLAERERLTNAGRRDSVLSYAWLVPTSAMPWFPFALVGGWWAWRGGAARRPVNVLLVAWFLCGVAVCTVIAFKVLHYILPAIVPVVILAAFGFDRLLARWQRRRAKSSRAAAGRWAIAGWFAAAAFGWGAWNAVVLPSRDRGREVERFAEAVNTRVPAGETIFLYRVGEDRTSWYLHRRLRQTQSVPTTRPAYLLMVQGDLADVQQIAAARVVVEGERYLARDADDERRLLVRVE